MNFGEYKVAHNKFKLYLCRKAVDKYWHCLQSFVNIFNKFDMFEKMKYEQKFK
jgi:hypothetical protein